MVLMSKLAKRWVSQDAHTHSLFRLSRLKKTPHPKRARSKSAVTGETPIASASAVTSGEATVYSLFKFHLFVFIPKALTFLFGFLFAVILQARQLSSRDKISVIVTFSVFLFFRTTIAITVYAMAGAMSAAR